MTKQKELIDKDRKIILDFLSKPRTKSEIANNFGFYRTTTKRYLDYLILSGSIIKIKNNKYINTSEEFKMGFKLGVKYVNKIILKELIQILEVKTWY